MPWKSITAIMCITAIAITAMVMGTDGAALATAIGLIAGLGGYFAGKARLP